MNLQALKPGPKNMVEEGVTFRNGEMIKTGEGCIFRKGAILDGKSETTPHGIVLGNAVEIAEYAFLYAVSGRIAVGDGAFIGPFSLLYGQGGLEIGKNVLIGGHTVIAAANHTFRRRDIPIKDQICSMKGIRIEDDVWVGAHVTILDGVRIGQGSVIGAGSVVTKDIPDFSVAFGNPCKVQMNRKKIKPPHFWQSPYRDYGMLNHIQKLEVGIASRNRQIRDLEDILKQKDKK